MGYRIGWGRGQVSYHFGPIGFPQKGKETEGIIKKKKGGGISGDKG